MNSLKRSLTLLLVAFCTAPILAFTTPMTEWFRQQIDQRLSVEFPGTPIGKSGEGTTLYYSASQEARYLVAAIHYNNQPHLNPITRPYPYYVSMLNSQLRDTKGTLVDSASFSIDSYKGLQYAITSLHPNGKTYITRTKRVIFVEGWVYQAEHLPLGPVTKTSQEKLHKFLASMRLTYM